MKTRAVSDGDEWVISGSKQWITNGPYADFAMVFAVTDPELARQRKGGITGFFVETGWPGFEVVSTDPDHGSSRRGDRHLVVRRSARSRQP